MSSRNFMNKELRMKPAVTALTLTAALLLSGCTIISMKPAPGSGNVGRALLDLDEAHEKNLITQTEYELLKNALLTAALPDDGKKK